jgi:hypothetical protein
VRGEVTLCGLSDAPIPWPIGKRGRSRNSLVVFKDLEKAIRRESNQAIAYWWGVTPQTVSKWRKALSVGIATEGLMPQEPSQARSRGSFTRAHRGIGEEKAGGEGCALPSP